MKLHVESLCCISYSFHYTLRGYAQTVINNVCHPRQEEVGAIIKVASQPHGKNLGETWEYYSSDVQASHMVRISEYLAEPEDFST